MAPTFPNPMADRLRALIAKNELIKMPCCFDGLSARLIEQAGFDLTFLSGFGASASRLGAPDTGLMSYGEVLDQARNAMQPLNIPMIADGDTGYDILILARTDARREHGLDEALARAEAFAEIGADILFVEEPYSVEEMATICNSVDGVHMANMLEGGQTPILPPEQLADIGFSIAAYPLTLLSAAMKAMNAALADLAVGQSAEKHLLDFADLREQIGFDEYHRRANELSVRG